MNSQQRRFARRHNLVNRFALNRAVAEIKQADACRERVEVSRWIADIKQSVFNRIVCGLAYTALAFAMASAWWIFAQ